ncbi:hypothetical protein EDB19DRAFT_1724608 [Suillus lakei]|nr:hypothetical protein EDB19DRAFT_1724608 [Suillus lakei]
MPKEDIDLPDWSKLSGTALSSAPHALTEVKQMSNQVVSPPDVNLPDWSKLSGAVLSRASDALTEIKQLRNQAMSRKDINMPNIDWSKVSGDLSRASDALTEAKQLVNQISMYRHWSSDMPMFQQYQEKVRRLIEMNCDLFGVHWTKVWRNILPGAYQLRDTILSDASKLWSIILSRAFRLWGVILCGPSKLWGAMLWGSSKLLGAVTLDTYKLWDTTRILLSTSDSNLCTALSSVSHALTGANIWCRSIKHPYVTAGVLLCISENPRILLTPLQLMGKPAPYTRTSTVSLNRGYYKNVDAHKAESTVVLSVSWLTGLGAVFVLGRTWGWWD